MFNSKVIRSLSLLLFFSLLLTGFGSVDVKAATNLINPNLIEWDNTLNSYPSVNNPSDSYEMNVRAISNVSGRILYQIMPSYLGSSGSNSDYPVYLGIMFDRSSFVAGNSYTFSLDIPSFDYIRSTTSFQYSDDVFVSKLGDGGYSIGFGVVDSSGSVQFISEFLSITKENYKSLQGTSYVTSFTCPSYSGGNPCIAIMSSSTYSYSSLYLDNSMTLVDNSEDDEDGFFDRLFEWFQKKFDAIGDSFRNLGDKLSTGLSNLGDRIKTFFSDLGANISSGLTAVKEGIQNKLDQVKTTLVELGESIINGIQSLFVPDEDFIIQWKDNLDKLLQDHLGMIYTSGNLVTDLLQKIFDIVFNAPETYGLTVPEVSFDILNGTQVNLIPETEISFDFMENKTFKFIYGLYTVGLYIAFGVLEVKYGIRVYNKVVSN